LSLIAVRGEGRRRGEMKGEEMRQVGVGGRGEESNKGEPR